MGQIELKGCSVQRFPRKGVPQGGVSSPYLFNDSQDSLLEIFDGDPHVSIDCYADDCVLLASGKNLATMRDKLQTAVDKCVSWAAGQGLSFSPEKTESMIFTRRRKWIKPKEIL